MSIARPETMEQTYCYIMLPLEWPGVHLLAYSGNIDPSDLAEHLMRIVEGHVSGLPGATGRCFSVVGIELTIQRVEEIGYACDCCGVIDPNMRVCGNCRFTRYCSRMCQRARWRDHRDTCSRIARVYTREHRRRRRQRLNYYGYVSAYTFHSWYTMARLS